MSSIPAVKSVSKPNKAAKVTPPARPRKSSKVKQTAIVISPVPDQKRGAKNSAPDFVMISDRRLIRDLGTAAFIAGCILGFDTFKGEPEVVIAHPVFDDSRPARPAFKHFPSAVLTALRALDEAFGLCEPNWRTLFAIIVCGALDDIVTKNAQRLSRRRKKPAQPVQSPAGAD